MPFPGSHPDLSGRATPSGAAASGSATQTTGHFEAVGERIGSRESPRRAPATRPREPNHYICSALTCRCPSLARADERAPCRHCHSARRVSRRLPGNDGSLQWTMTHQKATCPRSNRPEGSARHLPATVPVAASTATVVWMVIGSTLLALMLLAIAAVGVRTFSSASRVVLTVN